MLCKWKDIDLETRTLFFSAFLTCRICPRWCCRGQKNSVENGRRENIVSLLNRTFRIFTCCALRSWSWGRIFSVSRHLGDRRFLAFLCQPFSVPDTRGPVGIGLGFLLCSGFNSYVSKHLTLITSGSRGRSRQSCPGAAWAAFMGHNLQTSL